MDFKKGLTPEPSTVPWAKDASAGRTLTPQSSTAPMSGPGKTVTYVSSGPRAKSVLALLCPSCSTPMSNVTPGEVRCKASGCTNANVIFTYTLPEVALTRKG